MAVVVVVAAFSPCVSCPAACALFSLFLLSSLLAPSTLSGVWPEAVWASSALVAATISCSPSGASTLKNSLTRTRPATMTRSAASVKPAILFSCSAFIRTKPPMVQSPMETLTKGSDETEPPGPLAAIAPGSATPGLLRRAVSSTPNDEAQAPQLQAPQAQARQVHAPQAQARQAQKTQAQAPRRNERPSQIAEFPPLLQPLARLRACERLPLSARCRAPSSHD